MESGGSWKSVFGGKRKNKVAPGDEIRKVRTLRESWDELHSRRRAAGRAGVNQNERDDENERCALHEGDDNAS